MLAGVTSAPGKGEGSEMAPLTEESAGLSQFAMRILDQLSLTSWLPATFLVGAAFLLFKLDSMRNIDVAKALDDLSDQSFGVLIVVFFAIIISAMVIQAFEFNSIRALEGYWPYLFSRLGLTRWRVGVHVRKRKRAIAKSRKRLSAAFEGAQAQLLKTEGVDWAVVQQLRESVLNPTIANKADGAVVAAAARLNWEVFSSARLLRAMEAAQRARQGWPAAHRVMPTRLGNILRSFEDELTAGKEGLRTYVIRHWHLLSPEQQRLHSQYRRRLDLYCEMVFVCAMLLVLSACLFSTGYQHWVALAVSAALFGVLALTCYRAAQQAAKGYGEILKLLERLRAAAAAATNQGGSTAGSGPAPQSGQSDST